MLTMRVSFLPTSMYSSVRSIPVTWHWPRALKVEISGWGPLKKCQNATRDCEAPEDVVCMRGIASLAAFENGEHAPIFEQKAATRLLYCTQFSIIGKETLLWASTIASAGDRETKTVRITRTSVVIEYSVRGARGKKVACLSCRRIPSII
jgi:hypothetical protein